MAARKRGGPNRSEFIREKLRENPATKLGDINEAWSAEGHSGGITGTLYYQVKKSMGLSSSRGGKKRGRPAGIKRTVQADASTPSASAGDDSYLTIEKSLDKLIAQASDLGDNRLADDLRAARRRASAKLV